VGSWPSTGGAISRGLQQFLGDPSVQAQLGSMFDGRPDVMVLAEREGWRAF
jgi:hypothetical protein